MIPLILCFFNPAGSLPVQPLLRSAYTAALWDGGNLSHAGKDVDSTLPGEYDKGKTRHGLCRRESGRREKEPDSARRRARNHVYLRGVTFI